MFFGGATIPLTVSHSERGGREDAAALGAAGVYAPCEFDSRRSDLLLIASNDR